MKTEDIFIIGMSLIGVVTIWVTGVGYNRDIEFAKAGLMQKIENGKVIWVKPEQK